MQAPNAASSAFTTETATTSNPKMAADAPALATKKLNAQMLLQVHDELVFEVPVAEVERTLPVIKKVMEEAPLPALSLSVPLAVDAHAANNWDEAH